MIALDAPADSASCFGLCMPDGPKHLEHQRLINLTPGQVSEHWIRVSPQRVAPLRHVMLGFPGLLVVGDLAFGAFFKSHPPRGFFYPCTLLSFTNVDRILTLLPQ